MTGARDKDQGLGLDAVVEERVEVDLPARELGIAGEPLGETAQRRIEIPRADTGEIRHRVGEVRQLEVDQGRKPGLVEEQVARPRVALTEDGPHRLPRHVPPQPLAGEGHHRQRLAHRPLVSRLPDVEVVERELLRRLGNAQDDGLELPGIDGVESARRWRKFSRIDSFSAGSFTLLKSSRPSTSASTAACGSS